MGAAARLAAERRPLGRIPSFGVPLVLVESLLEMLYFGALRAYFERLFGVKVLRILKPSARQEVWVGFDQGWLASTHYESDLLRDIRTGIQGGTRGAVRGWIGFFLQFKRVKARPRRSVRTPATVHTPYFEVPIRLKASPTTGISQHATLRKLARLREARVAYSCPMIFTRDEALVPLDLTVLRCVPPETAPSSWVDGEEHQLVFRTPLDTHPLWCSEPMAGRSLSFPEWATVDNLDVLDTDGIRAQLTRIRHALSDFRTQQFPQGEEIIPPSYTLLELEHRPNR